MIVRMRESNVYASTRAYMNARRRALQEAMRWLNYYAYVTNTCAYVSHTCSISGFVLCLIVLLLLYIVQNTRALTLSSKGWFPKVAMMRA